MKHSRGRQQSHAGGGQLRIIGGTWRSRKLPVADVEGLRPTPDRVRETLFNWLTGWVDDARCLDAFSGTGALGLEALSRGASETVFLEYSAKAVQTLKSNLQALRADNAKVEQTDALQWLSRPALQTFNLVFLDPPFRKQLLQPVCEQLQSNGWLAQDALVYVEAEKELSPLPVPANWKLWKEKSAGQVISCLYRVA
ncbi:MAG: 16S rRNA (guanine(966)-N(2))-methyltransferase RsmD [Oceanospirillales bacterium LUC14_002_19_P2]|nr:MAG: 16S rRNA (guanine(966)-N(2))-methyltransferase RsmD [Oceanospirillales bacterium LUC14_002_19_P2]